MGEGLPSVEKTQDATPDRAGDESRGESPRGAEGLRGRGMQVGAIDAERLRSAVASKLFGVEAEPVKIGRFTVLKRLGAGGMGVVYSAYDDQLDRKLAIKLLKGEANEQRKARLMREAQALARVSHPNVIHVYEVDTFRGQIYLAMEFVRGRPLDQVDRKPDGEASLEEVMDWFRQAGEGLAGAHEAGLVHRDFKPENCLVGDDGRVRVLDFGLARASGEELEVDDGLDEDERQQVVATRASSNDDHTRTAKLTGSSGSIGAPLTRTGAIMGTPAYMAPEQHLGGAVDERSDQFSFCVSLWEKLYGERPFEGNTLPALALSVTRGKLKEPPPGRGVPGWIHRVLVRGLSVDPADRWPDMRTLLTQLSGERRRRMRLVGGFALVGSLALASVAWSATREQAGPCDDSASELKGVWDKQVRQRIEKAFTATGSGIADEVYTGTGEALDAYAREWAELNQATCVARKVEKTDNSDLYGRKMMCLGQRLARVEEFVAELEQIDADSLPLVRRTADNLPPLQDCVDPEALARVGGPVDEAMQGKVDAAERTLARVQTKIDLGRYNEALELAGQARADAGAAKNPRVEAKALLLQGTAQIKIKDYKAAEKSLRESLRRADVARDDETRAKGWITLLRLIGSKKKDFDRVDDLAADASAALERLGDAPLLWADYYTNLGSISKARNDPDKALEFHAKALEIRQAELGERSVQVAISRINTGNALRNKGEFEKAEALSREGYEVMRDVLGQWHPNTGTAAFNLVAILGDRAAAAAEADKEVFFAEMETLLRDALAGNERRMGKDHRSAGTIINNLAQLLLDKKQYELAKVEFDRALRVRTSFLPPDHVDVAQVHMGFAETLLALGELEPALEHARAANETYDLQVNQGDHNNRGLCRYVLARVQFASGSKDEGLAQAREARSLFEKAGQAGKVGLSDVNAWLSEHEGASP